MIKKITLWTLMSFLLFSIANGCSDDDDGSTYYIRFDIDGTTYSLERGLQGINSNNSEYNVTLRSMPGAYTVLSPGVYPLYFYATKDTLPLGRSLRGSKRHAEDVHTNQCDEYGHLRKHPDTLQASRDQWDFSGHIPDNNHHRIWRGKHRICRRQFYIRHPFQRNHTDGTHPQQRQLLYVPDNNQCRFRVLEQPVIRRR